MKRFLLLLAGCAFCALSQARSLTVDASQLNSLKNADDVTELTVTGFVAQALQIDENKLPSLRHLVYADDVAYIPGGSFKNCPELQTAEFRGLVGHSDGYCFFNCPKLVSVTFGGPVMSTGGPLYMQNCPLAEKVVFNGLVLSTGFGENPDCPSFKGYEVNGMVLNNSMCNDTLIPLTSDAELQTRRQDFMPQAGRLSRFIADCLASRHSDWLFQIAGSSAKERLTEVFGMPETASEWEMSGTFADPDRTLSKLDLLKKSAPYHPGRGEPISFKYAPPTDSALTDTRIRFNLDSVAGTGDELSRMCNLLHFVHETVRHDGSSPWPEVPFNFGALYDICQTDNRGLNCRFMAIMLTELLLAEGIPARYLTCLPKFNDTDSDCHVITAAWSSQLGKWVWLDPTWDTWVKDENDVMLGPAEVRQRLIDGKPLKISENANWNHQSKATVDDYLNDYMAKNLYIIGCNTVNRPEPEGSRFTTGGERGDHVYLVPEGIRYGNNNTLDPAAFWAAPDHQ